MTVSLPERARVVIIGGGVIGCSVAYHLTKLGWIDVLLLERKQLTCGTTWHAAGLIGQLRATRNMTQLAKYSAELYTTLEAETEVATGFKQNGSISLALSDDRLEELKRGASMARTFGLEVEVLTPQDCKEAYPLINAEGVTGGVFLPKDGQADPANIALALAKGARNGGAKILEGVKVTAIRQKDGRVTGVGTDHGEIACEAVVNCGRHVGPRGRPHGRRQRAAAGLRAFLHRHREHPRAAARPAGPAGAGRMRLLQGGRRQDPARRLRAQGQALGHGRHPGGLLLRPVARGLRPLRADPGGRDPAPADPRDRGHPHLLQRSGELHPGRPLPAGRGAGVEGFLLCRRLQLDRHPVGRRRRQGAGRVDGAGAPPFDLWDVDIRRMQPFQGTKTYLLRAFQGNAGPALRRSLPLPAVRDRTRRPAFAAARAPGRGRRLLRRGRRLGTGQLVPARRSRAPASDRSTAMPGHGRTGSTTRRPSTGRCAKESASST